MQKGPRILVVDDDQTNLKFLKEILDDDYQLLTVTSGEAALNIIHTFDPQVMLLDIMLPGISGYEVCKTIRQDAKLSQMKIILISAKAMVNERQKGYESGADDYITKPFDHEELLVKIRTILE
jgi:DNA-binding response OmpR family regulator